MDFGFGALGLSDQGLPSLPVEIAATGSAFVGLMSAWVQGHGACPQGKHLISAVLVIANVSVLLLLGFSDLQ